jgi:hypothetical protein
MYLLVHPPRLLPSILKHMDIMEEDGLEVFFNALDDRSIPTSPTPFITKEDRTLALNFEDTPPTSTKDTINMEDPSSFGNGHGEVNKAVSNQGMKSYV